MEEKPLIQELSVPLYQAKGWMKLLGVVMIVHGVLTALSLVGIIVAWLPIWLGVLLFKSAGMVEGAQLSGDKTQMLEGLRKLKTYFVINGVLMLIVLVLIAASFLMFGAGIFALLSESGGMQGW
jgi:hypothetical protein